MSVLIAHARQLRKNQTDAERLIWRQLRNRRIAGLKFRRQHPVGRFILDFYCASRRLAIEIDGGGHAEDQQERYDARRTAFLEARGIRVLRFWNHEVLRQTDLVMDAVYAAISLRSR